MRLGISKLDGIDRLGRGSTKRSREEMKMFSEIVGKDPATLPPASVGWRFPNKVGDYDALRDHYADKRDVFLTLDKRDYLHIDKRATYWQRLRLKIMCPAEFVAEYSRR